MKKPLPCRDHRQSHRSSNSFFQNLKIWEQDEFGLLNLPKARIVIMFNEIFLRDAYAAEYEFTVE